MCVPDDTFPDEIIVSSLHPSASCGNEIVCPVSLITLFFTIPSLILVATPQTRNLEIAVAVANDGLFNPKLSILPKSINLLLYSGIFFSFKDLRQFPQT